MSVPPRVTGIVGGTRVGLLILSAPFLIVRANAFALLMLVRRMVLSP